MLINIRFDTQVRKLAGCNRMSVNVDDSASLEQIIRQVADQGTAQLRDNLLDSQGSIRSSILVFLDDDLVDKDKRLKLHEGSELTFSTLISGG